MEPSEPSRELLNNVVLNDTQQFMIHRLPENAQLLSNDLLQSHNGLVVDLAGGDFIPVTYTSEELLSQDLTEEDRNLAAALVAVQLSQQQKQQQIQDATLPNIGGSKLLDEQILLGDKCGNPPNSYLQIVGSETIYVEKAEVSKDLNTIKYNSATGDFEASSLRVKHEEKKELDTDPAQRNDSKCSKKNLLPHKKRISRKLKKPPVANTKRFVCNLCEQIFISSEDFAQHQLLCQTTITPVMAFACQLCSASFQDQLRFFEHLKKHYEPGNQSTQPSEPPPPPQQQFQKPEKKSDSKPESSQDALLTSLMHLTCMTCNKTFRRQKAFEAHMRDIHEAKDEPLNEFSEPEDLMEGINVVEPSDTPSDMEDSKAWYREEDLHQTEEDLKELEAVNEHVCHICNQPFAARALLLQHLVTCRPTNGEEDTEPSPPQKKKGKKKGPLHCTECDRVFIHRNSLLYHMRGHSGVRPHQCDHCGKAFFASSALKVHLRLHSGDKPYKCQECGKMFRQWGDLKYHITSIHSNEKQFQCEYCGKEFARKYSLIVHRRIHTGEKNYKCDYCEKTFRASSYLQNHRRIHTGEKPHPCGVCGKPFRVRSDMKRHQRTHMKEPYMSHKESSVIPGGFEEIPAKLEKAEDIEIEEGTELKLGVGETAEMDEVECGGTSEILEYDGDELVQSHTIRVPNRNLYINGHELFLVTYPGELPMRSVATTESASGNSAWIHADS